MSSTPEDNLLHFDLSLLQDSPRRAKVSSELQDRKTTGIYIYFEKKVKCVNDYVNNVIYFKQRSEESSKREAQLSEENKQICINYNNSLEKIKKLEKDVEISHRHIKELQEKLETSQNQYKAIQSHANQLQELVLDCETQIESLKIENQLAKVNTKAQTKIPQSQKIEYDTLINDLCLLRDVVLGKKNLQSHHKVILKKYDKFKSKTDDSASECSVDDIEDVFSDSASLFSPPDLLPKTKKQQVHRSLGAIELEKDIHNDDLTIKRIFADHDSDSNNEIVSEDTGRGSSLACSDIEKCFNSPDYFITNSPLDNAIKDKKNYADISTSPITVQIERSDACTSPVLFSNNINGFNVEEKQKQTRDIGITVHVNDLIAHRNVATSPNKIKVHDRALSPLKIPIVDRAISPIEINDLEVEAIPVQENVQEKSTIPIVHVQEARRLTSTEFEGTCLRTQTSLNGKESVVMNNSEVLDDNEGSDCEVENILKSVRLDYKVITPIPKSPGKEEENKEHSNAHNPDAEYMQIEYKAFKEFVFARFINDGKVTTNNCNGNDVTINMHEKDMAEGNSKTVESLLQNSKTVEMLQNSKTVEMLENSKTIESSLQNSKSVESPTRNFKIIESPLQSSKTIDSPLQNSATKSNFVSTTEPPGLEISSANVRVRNENHIHNNESEDKIINQDFVIRCPIEVIDKVKKTKKLTQLEKLRKKLTPKCKIRRDPSPPNRKISRLKPILFQKSIPDHSSTPEKNNKTAYENAVKVLAELKANEKTKRINLAPLKHALDNNNITKEIQIVIPKCDGLIAQNKNIINNVKLDSKPSPSDKSTVKSNAVGDNDSCIKNNTKTYRNKKPNEIENSPSQLFLRRSKRLSSTPSGNSDISNITVIEKEDNTKNEVNSHEQIKHGSSDKTKEETLCKSLSSLVSNDSDLSNGTVIEKKGGYTINAVKTYQRHKHVPSDKIQGEPTLSKLLSSSVSNDFDISNKTVIDKEKDCTVKEVKTYKRIKKPVPSNKPQSEPTLSKLLSSLVSNNVDILNKTVIEKVEDYNKNDDNTYKRIQHEPLEKSLGEPILNKHLPLLVSNTLDISNKNAVEKEDHCTLNEVGTYKRIRHDPSDKIQGEPILSKCFSLSVSDILDISNENVLEKEDHTVNEVKSSKRIKHEPSDKTQGEPKKLLSVDPHSLDKANTEERVNIAHNNTTPNPIEYRRRSKRLSSQNSPTNKHLKRRNPSEGNCSDHDTSTTETSKHNKRNKNTSDQVSDPRDSILFRMINKYAKKEIRRSPNLQESKVKTMHKKIEDGIARFISISTNNLKETVNRFVKDISNSESKYFLAGLINYLKDPARKDEMYSKVSILNSPPMTKSERVLLYILKQLQFAWPHTDFVEDVLRQIEFVLFQLNHTPDFGAVESMSHFYAVLCRYFNKLTRLRLFMIDAMYCVQFKSVAIIKQCVEVWMHILPLAHMGMAKSPIVACLIYLLHFFKCEDKFNRVQEIRHILGRKYFYQVTEWTESSILEMLQNAVTELSAIPVENRMLRICLIVMAKRKGPQWCHKHIVNNILLPLIEKDGVAEKIKNFCISMLGPLLKPYPNHMKVNSEIVFDKLIKMLDDASPSKKEAIFSSLLCMTRHNQARVNLALLAWGPDTVSPAFKRLLVDYIKEKEGIKWFKHIDRIYYSYEC